LDVEYLRATPHLKQEKSRVADGWGKFIGALNTFESNYILGRRGEKVNFPAYQSAYAGLTGMDWRLGRASSFYARLG